MGNLGLAVSVGAGFDASFADDADPVVFDLEEDVAEVAEYFELRGLLFSGVLLGLRLRLFIVVGFDVFCLCFCACLSALISGMVSVATWTSALTLLERAVCDLLGLQVLVSEGLTDGK